ncbi:C40 family peptidase [Arcobacter sp. LA11]|uniref:C40 family peptidase n=1 Tax=Arcobacter sp. LA11 TaxID=1898176 RepID=UPI0009345473|nr:C40 family peptidase [Arcobacter sp. LA11]
MKILKPFIYIFIAFGASYLYLYGKPALTNEKEENSKINTVNKVLQKNSNTSTKNIISLAKSKIGSPYLYSKNGPSSFDCSGFVYYIFKENNINLPRTSIAQSEIGTKVSVDRLKKGDLVFFDTSLKGQVNHSGIYLGDDKFIHASSGKANGVTISDMNGWYKDKFKWGIRKDTLPYHDLTISTK